MFFFYASQAKFMKTGDLKQMCPLDRKKNRLWDKNRRLRQQKKT